MKSVARQVRMIEDAIDRQRACRKQISALELELRETDAAILGAKEALVLHLARERGILALAPALILAALEVVRIPESSIPVFAHQSAVDEAHIQSDVHLIVVRFGSHPGPKTALLKSVGLTRNGKSGEWHGRVDRATLNQLRELFAEKMRVLSDAADSNINPIHQQSAVAGTVDRTTNHCGEVAETGPEGMLPVDSGALPRLSTSSQCAHLSESGLQIEEAITARSQGFPTVSPTARVAFGLPARRPNPRSESGNG